RRPDADVLVAARAAHDRHVTRPQAVQVIAVELHAMHGNYAAIEKAELFEVCHRRDTRRLPRIGPDAKFLEQDAPRPASPSDGLHLLRRFTEVHAGDLTGM